MSNLSNVVGKVAPLLGGVLNVFLPGAGLVVQGLANIFGADPSNPDDLAAKISADANAAEKLKEFEILHQDDLLKLIQQDQASARDMNIQTTKTTGKSDYMLHVLGLGAFLMVFCYVILGFFIPAKFDKGVFHDLLNVLTFVFSFYFGGMYIQSRAMTKRDSTPELPPPGETK